MAASSSSWPLMLLLLVALTAPALQAAQAAAAVSPPANLARVEVDLFVMSLCPDAVFCEGFLRPVLTELSAVVAVHVHFIGDKQRDGSWRCRHGEHECTGNVQQLCVQAVTKPYNLAKWLLGFIDCSNQLPPEAVGQFTTASKCLREAGIPLAAATKALACMAGPGHTALLEEDFARTAGLGVSTSCTVQIEGQTVAVRDGGKWKQTPSAGSTAEDFKDALCEAFASKYRGRLPPACRGPAAIAVA